MRLKLDENLPTQLSPALRTLGHDVHTVPEEALSGRNDHEIWQTARKESRFLITQDLDFSDSRLFAPGTHHGLLIVRLRSPSKENLIERIQEIAATENVEEWKGCFVVATELKIRVLRPYGK
jgi:predicted nuclease of predicted toxin-antitoxin system